MARFREFPLPAITSRSVPPGTLYVFQRAFFRQVEGDIEWAEVTRDPDQYEQVMHMQFFKEPTRCQSQT